MKKFIIFLVSISMCFVGCEKIEQSESTPKTQNKSESSKIKDNHINITMVKPKTLNPIINKNESVNYVLSLVYDGLFTIDENYNVVPQLVSEYGIYSDGLGIDITLKDATWHDGSSITPEDVLFSVDFIKNNPESPYSVFVQNIDTVQVTGVKSCTIKFKEKYAFSKETLIFPIIQKNEMLLTDQNTNVLVGNGKYKISSYEPRKGLYLVPNENYYDKEIIPKNEIKVELVPDEEAQSSMLLSLKSDISSVKLNDLSSFYEEQFNIKKFEGRVFESVLFNYNNKFIQDVNFRRALVSVINKNAILEESYILNANLVDFPLNSKSIYYDDTIKTLPYSVENAKKYLENVKVKRDEEEIKNETNEQNNLQIEIYYSKEQLQKKISELDLQIIVNKENTERIKTAYQITKGLKEIGIKSTVLELSEDELDVKIQNQEYDMALIGWELSSVPDVTNIIKSIGYTDLKLEGYLNSLRLATTQNQISGIYKSIQKYVNENALFVSLVIRDEFIVSNSRLKGEINPNSFDIYEGISNLDL